MGPLNFKRDETGRIITNIGPHALIEFYGTKPQATREQNRYMQGMSCNAESEGFARGTAADLAKPYTDFTLYDRATRELEKTGVLAPLVESTQVIRARSRVRSEYDGEYDHDRRWDIQPFMQRKVEQRPGRVLNLNVHCDFSAGVEGEAINRYAALISALVGLVETNGVRVNLTVQMDTNNIASSGNFGMGLRMAVKASDQYFSAGDLLKVLGSNFYRRAYFLVIILAADFVGRDVNFGLGQPLNHGKRVEFNAETETVDIYSMPGGHEQAALIRNLTAFIQGKGV